MHKVKENRVYLKIVRHNEETKYVSVIERLEKVVIDELLDLNYNLKASTAEEWDENLVNGKVFELSANIDIDNLEITLQ